MKYLELRKPEFKKMVQEAKKKAESVWNEHGEAIINGVAVLGVYAVGCVVAHNLGRIEGFRKGYLEGGHGLWAPPGEIVNVNKITDRHTGYVEALMNDQMYDAFCKSPDVIWRDDGSFDLKNED